jgi:hypothetical protein
MQVFFEGSIWILWEHRAVNALTVHCVNHSEASFTSILVVWRTGFPYSYQLILGD